METQPLKINNQDLTPFPFSLQTVGALPNPDKLEQGKEEDQVHGSLAPCLWPGRAGQSLLVTYDDALRAIKNCCPLFRM
jgi:hypothetical protein